MSSSQPGHSGCDLSPGSWHKAVYHLLGQSQNVDEKPHAEDDARETIMTLILKARKKSEVLQFLSLGLTRLAILFSIIPPSGFPATEE